MDDLQALAKSLKLMAYQCAFEACPALPILIQVVPYDSAPKYEVDITVRTRSGSNHFISIFLHAGFIEFGINSYRYEDPDMIQNLLYDLATEYRSLIYRI